jgi:hypothetical protein
VQGAVVLVEPTASSSSDGAVHEDPGGRLDTATCSSTRMHAAATWDKNEQLGASCYLPFTD